MVNLRITNPKFYDCALSFLFFLISSSCSSHQLAQNYLAHGEYSYGHVLVDPLENRSDQVLSHLILNPDGSLMVNIKTEKINYRALGNWQPLKTNGMFRWIFSSNHRFLPYYSYVKLLPDKDSFVVSNDEKKLKEFKL